MDVVVAHRNAHGVGRDCHAFDDDMRVELEDVAVFAGTWLTFVGIAYKVLLTRELARHEAPFQTGWKTGPSSPTQTRLLHGGNDLVLAQTFSAMHTQNTSQRLVSTPRFIVFQMPIFSI